LDSLQLEIARFLLGKAIDKKRTTYEEVGDAVAWRHPTGRGLGKNLDVILHYLLENRLPPLTTILVRKGEKHPPPNVITFIQANYSYQDIDEAQESVFAFDWASVAELSLVEESLPTGRQVWLTSFWGFDPEDWGCIGFADEKKRDRYIRHSKPGALVAIYVTKGRGPKEMRGKVVGILEVSHQIGHASKFISGDRWAEKENNPEYRGKWLFAVKATRAWKIIPEQWKPVEELFPTAYAGSNAELIGSNGIQVPDNEAHTLSELEVYETPVYGHTSPIDNTIQTLQSALSPSRAGPIASGPYSVGETDGPKYLYILKLKGDIATYLGRSPKQLAEMSIIKVGFSRSPLSRRNQIQSAYPRGQFEWGVWYPENIVYPPPYPHEKIALAGEDAMKKRLVDNGAESLGVEFFLADDGLVVRTWYAGKFAADSAAETEAEQSAALISSFAVVD